MDTQRRKKLEKAGFRVGTTREFLELTPEEEAHVEIRLDISRLIKASRNQRGWTQKDLAEAMGSSQSRVAKMEAGDPSTSLDLMVKALLKLDVSREEIGEGLKGNLETA